MRVRNLNGYRVIYLPEHPAAMTNNNWEGFVYEHIVVAEDFLKRRLKKNEVCHHLDGNRTNNRTGNLLILSKAQHTKLHTWLKKGAPGSESFGVERVNSGKSNEENTHTCLNCGKTLQRKQKKCCSKTCAGLMKRKVRPTKEELQNDIENLSWLLIGKKYSVSDNATRKWARQYGLLG